MRCVLPDIAVKPPNKVIDINEFVTNLATEASTWKHWMVVLVSVTYQHIFSDAELQNEVYRFVFDVKGMRMERRKTTEEDKKQTQDKTIWSTLGAS